MGSVSPTQSFGPSRHDTALSASSRFLVEVAAWVGVPWAAFELTLRWWVAVAVGLIVLTLPAVFSTPGDKHQIVVATPGPIRVGIEIILDVVAVWGAWVAWGTSLALGVMVVVAVSVLSGRVRIGWLLAGAPTAP